MNVSLIFGLFCAMLSSPPVNLALLQTACVDQVVAVDLIATSQDRLTQRVAAISVILKWPAEELSFLRLETADAGVDWMVAGFLNDPDGINDDVNDGLAILTLLSLPGDPAIMQTRCGTVLATLTFELVNKNNNPTVQIVAGIGEFGQTAVYLFDVVGGNVVGVLEDSRITCRNPTVKINKRRSRSP